jgi:hypothetical protein
MISATSKEEYYAHVHLNKYILLKMISMDNLMNGGSYLFERVYKFIKGSFKL